VDDYPDQTLFGLPPQGPAFRVSVTVTGLQDPGLVLVSGSSTLSISTAGTYTFDNTYPEGSSYSVVIQTRPAGYECTIANGSGTVNANVDNVRVDCLRVATVTPANDSVLQSTQDIRLVFSRSMTGCTVDNTTPPLGSNLGTDVSSATLQTTNVANDTLVLSTAGWGSGSFNFLTLNNCQSSDGTVSMTVNLTYLVATNVAYVATTGADAGTCGTVVGACATINYAINELVTAGCNGTIDCAVLVAEGPPNATAPHFRDVYDLSGNAINMSNRISLMGSFTTDFSNRFPGARNSIITGTGSLCGVGPCHIRVPGTVNVSTVIDGFAIVGDESTAPNSYGVVVNGAVRLTNNHIMGGNGTGLRVALDLSGSGISIITGNRIEIQGNTAGTARAVVLSAGGMDLYRNQIITNGAVNNAEPIVLLGGTGNIHTNGIFTGVADNTTTILIASLTSYNIMHNMIIAGQANTGTSAGIHFQTALAGGAIYNNIILGNTMSAQSFCMRESVALPNTVHLDSNNLFVCPDGLMENSLGIAYSIICDEGFSVPANRGTFGTPGCATMYTNAGTKSNLSMDPIFVNPGAGDFHYSASSPCLLVQGGVDPTTYSGTIRPDADFRTRPGDDGLHSIGPYEPTNGCL
tara:strand:+ start:493 stop:2394 length:1902 start_codon:yes stop_codon:yes gene_type:complete